MPFDAAGFSPRPERPKPSGPSDTVITVLIVLVASCTLILPLSVAAFIDIVAYFRGG